MKKIRLLLLSVAIMVVGASFAATSAQASNGLSSTLTVIGVSGQLILNGIFTCDTLLELTLTARTFRKTRGGIIGNVTGGFIRNCQPGGTTGRILTPIPVTYQGFTGTLPNITGILVDAGTAAAPVGFEVNIPLVGACLYGGTADTTLEGVTLTRDTVSRRVSSALFTGSTPLGFLRGALGCPRTGTITQALTVFLGTGAPVITLI